MNRVLGMGRSLYRCAQCGREVFPKGDYMPRHRPPGKRRLCEGTGSHVKANKKVKP